MAEAALFSLAAKILLKLGTPPFKTAYKRVKSIWGAKKDVDKLEQTIRTIQASLLDAEKKQDDSAAVRDWTERVRDVLYEADDLFDEVSTDALLSQLQMKEDKLLTKVRASVSKSIPIISNNDTAKKVKSIRKRLDDISRDMVLFNLLPSHESDNRVSGLRKGADTWPFVDEKAVVGRDREKNDILEFLFDKSDVEKSGVSVIAIVGIGGMGKTLAQLIYHDKEVCKNFAKKWWACISDVGETEVLERIVEAMNGQSNHGCDPKELISKSVSSSGNYLLVLDDVWDNDLGIWFDIMSLLCSGAKGSKIIVTTRFLSVPRALRKDRCKIHTLNGLSEQNSWELFKRIAFTAEQENDPNWVSLGREIMKKCANVPLALKSIAGLLCTKDTMQEWECIKNERLMSDDSIRSVLKLSYDHLPSNLKHCFAYCSLYPKDYRLCKQDLIYLWISQGYVKPKENETLEAAGHVYFMELLRRSFFQETRENCVGEILYCKMHDVVHDLAQDMAGKGSVMVTEGFNQFHKKIRHASVVFESEISESWNIPPPLLEADRLRSCLVSLYCSDDSSPVLDQQIMKFRFLRALNLSHLHIMDVPSSIGELKYLRYLNLSENSFEALPDSITKLVNLLTLDVSHCDFLVALPNDFRKLISLRHLNISYCYELDHMPPGFGELTSLQHLSDFKVSKRGGDDGKSNDLDALAGLNLQGQLIIHYSRKDGWSEDELLLASGQIPEGIDLLSIEGYPSMRMPIWWKEDPTSRLFKLKYLSLDGSRKTKHLPPLRRLPFLEHLCLCSFDELEYIEEEEVVPTTPFFPSLRFLRLNCLLKLKGWSRRQETVAATNEDQSVRNPEQPFFSLLTDLKIHTCLLLKSMPLSPHLQQLHLARVSGEMVHQLVSACSSSSQCTNSSSSSLQRVRVVNCNDLTSFPGEGLTSLRRLHFHDCPSLEVVRLMSIALEELAFHACPNLKVLDYCGNNSFLANLRWIFLDKRPVSLADCLRQRIALGQLRIGRYDTRAGAPSTSYYLDRGLHC